MPEPQGTPERCCQLLQPCYQGTWPKNNINVYSHAIRVRGSSGECFASHDDILDRRGSSVLVDSISVLVLCQILTTIELQNQ